MINPDMILADLPFGNGTSPNGPSEMNEKLTKAIGFAKYIGFFCAIIGLIVAGAAMAVSRREGSSEEATAMAMRIGFGTLIIGAAVAIITFFI